MSWWDKYKNLAVLIVGGLLILHIFATMWAQHVINRELWGVLLYIDASTRLQRQICRNTAPHDAERKECDQW